MYEEFYGFREKPFQIIPNPEYLYKSQKHRNALTLLEYGLAENIGFILLTGEIGSGKTTLIQYMLSELNNDIEVAVIFNTNVSAYQLLLLILSGFEIDPPSRNKAVALETLNKYLVAKYAENKHVLLIIDEAQNLSTGALEEIRMLSNLHTEDQALLQIMLVGQPELLKKLQNPNLLQLSQRIAVNFHLEGLSYDEVSSYISYRLRKAGGKQNLFTAKAVEMIYELSEGIPRSINLLCQAALVYGYADEKRMITKDIIDQIIEDKIGISFSSANKRQTTVDDADSTIDLPESALRRLEMLEKNVHNIQLQVRTQLRETEQRAKGFKKDLENRLTRLLEKERARSENLLQKFSQLQLKYDTLKGIRAKLEDDLESRRRGEKRRHKSSE